MSKKTGAVNHPNGGETLFDLRKIYAIIVKNWLVLKSDNLRLIPMMMFPIIMIVVFGYASTGTPHGIPAVLVDYDHTPASMQFTTSLRTISSMSLRYSVATESEAKKMMDEGQVKAMLVIPAGFGQALETGQSVARFVVKVDESDSTVAQILRGLLQQRTAAFSNAYAIARVQAMQGREASVSQTMDATAQSLNAFSDSLSGDPSLWTDDQALNSLTVVFNQDLQNARVAEDAVLNQVGVVENADNLRPYNSTSNNSVQSSTSTDFEAQLVGARALIGRDQAALAKIAQLKASNAARAQGPLPASLSSAASGLQSSSSSLQAASMAPDAVLSPIAYVEEPAYGEGRKNIDFLLPAILALVIFQGAVQGMGRALAGEKKDGSLTRVFLTPTSNATILTGTMLFYMMFESIRSSFVVFVAMLLFGVTLKGSILVMLGVIMLYAMGCTAIGLLLSAVTNSQEQYISVSMLVSLPAIFLSGVFFPIQTMPAVLQSISGLLPLSYAATALRGVMIKGFEVFTILPQIVILFAFTAAFTALALIVFKREIA